MRSLHKFGLALIRNGALLVVREFGHTLYLIPGGRPEPGESPVEALRRELREELDCDFDSTSARLLGEYTDKAANEPNTTITVTLFGGELRGTPKPSQEIEELLWFIPGQHDAAVLAPSIRNKILPDLIARGLIQRQPHGPHAE